MAFVMVVGALIFFCGLLVGMAIERVARGEYDTK